ncbi:ribonuclease H-like domain-containing protein [Tanacetum coccineum]
MTNDLLTMLLGHLGLASSSATSTGINITSKQSHVSPVAYYTLTGPCPVYYNPAYYSPTAHPVSPLSHIGPPPGFEYPTDLMPVTLPYYNPAQQVAQAPRCSVCLGVVDVIRTRVLLRCDSTGDLYPVTHPSPIPRAFLVSQHTWNQRLGHPGGDVLHRLVSNNVIYFNNEKPPVLYHAFQLGKHDGSLSRYNAHLVVNGSTQLKGLMLMKPLVWLLNRTVYMHQPTGFRDFVHPDYMRLLQRSDTTYLLLYVDDIVLTDSSTAPVTNSKKYAVEILERADMVNCNLSRTPEDTESKLGNTGNVVSDPTLYRSFAGSLQYLTFTRPDISYAVDAVIVGLLHEVLQLLGREPNSYREF